VFLQEESNPVLLICIWAITEKRGIYFLNPGFVFLASCFVELNVQIIRKNKQLPI
jgi:hypothetical protein